MSELFARGFRRRRDAPLAIEGDACSNDTGYFALFSLDIADGRIRTVGFRSSSCATLIAYCELIAETVPGFRREIADAGGPASPIASVAESQPVAVATNTIAALASAAPQIARIRPYALGAATMAHLPSQSTPRRRRDAVNDRPR